MELSCAHAEESCRVVAAVAKRLEKAARGLEQAARAGDVAKMGKLSSELTSVLSESADALRSAQATWPYTDDSVSAYLAGAFENELIDAAHKSGCNLTRLDDRLTAFPVVVEIAPKTKSVKIDGKRITALRPSSVVREILRRQAAQGLKPERFIEILYSGYRALGQARGVHLADVYELLTILPESKASYSRADFARDIYLLDSSAVRRTKDGSVVSFMGATGTKGSAKVLTVIPPDGMPKHYHAVLFSGNA